MWRLAVLSLCLGLSACGFSAWRETPFFSGSDPYMPAGGGENLRRAQGIPVNVEPLQQEPGNIWPESIQQEPTLETLQQQGGQLPSGVTPPPLPPQRGSSTPPPATTPVPVPTVPPVPPAATPANPPIAGAPAPLKVPATPTAPAPANPPVAGGPVYQTPQGPGVSTGGTGAYQTITLPNGTTAIVVPNGNGTSTIIRSDGTVETVPTPR